MMLPDDYICAVADAVHAVGGIFALDCVASGAMWVDMQALGVTCCSAPRRRVGALRLAAGYALGTRVRALIEPMPPAMSAT